MLTFVTLVSALLSLVAILVIALSYATFSALRTYPFRLVMYLLGANFGSTLAYLMGVGGGRWTDVYQAPAALCTCVAGGTGGGGEYHLAPVRVGGGIASYALGTHARMFSVAAFLLFVVRKMVGQGGGRMGRLCDPCPFRAGCPHLKWCDGCRHPYHPTRRLVVALRGPWGVCVSLPDVACVFPGRTCGAGFEGHWSSQCFPLSLPALQAPLPAPCPSSLTSPAFCGAPRSGLCHWHDVDA